MVMQRLALAVLAAVLAAGAVHAGSPAVDFNPKAEFQRYAEVWRKLSQQLQTAQNTIDEAGRRSRALARKLRDVEIHELLPGTSEPNGER